MNPDYLWIGILFFSVIPHEMGHYLAYKRYGRIVKHRFRWFGYQVGSEGDNLYLTNKQFFEVILMGPIMGYLLIYPAYAFTSMEAMYIFIYLLMCSMDFIMLYYTYHLGKDHGWDTNMRRAIGQQHKDFTKEHPLKRYTS